MLRALPIIAAFLAITMFAPVVHADLTLYTPAPGDGTYSWNSKFGPWGYGQGGTDMSVGLSMGGQWGNDFQVAIFEIPIAALAGKSMTSATLVVESLGFSTGYYYGSAAIGWLDTGSSVLTGDFIADNLGPAATGRPGGYSIYNSDYDGSPGTKTFDVTSVIQQDVAAGRSYSTFMMSSSRDTWGAIKTAESGAGPRLEVAGVVPEPASLLSLGVGLVGLAGRLRSRR